jgi:hypothetical protein
MSTDRRLDEFAVMLTAILQSLVHNRPEMADMKLRRLEIGYGDALSPSTLTALKAALALVGRKAPEAAEVIHLAARRS